MKRIAGFLSYHRGSLKILSLLAVAFLTGGWTGCNVGSPTQSVIIAEGTPTPTPTPTPSPTPCQLFPAGAPCGDNLQCCSRSCVAGTCR